MTYYFHARKKAHASARGCHITLVLCALFSANVQAQSAAKLPEKEAASTAKPISAPSKIDLRFKSTFDHYKPYSEEKISSWKGANDEVGRIGGWRAYLKEAHEPPQTKPAPPHVGHGGK